MDGKLTGGDKIAPAREPAAVVADLATRVNGKPPLPPAAREPAEVAADLAQKREKLAAATAPAKPAETAKPPEH